MRHNLFTNRKIKCTTTTNNKAHDDGIVWMCALDDNGHLTNKIKSNRIKLGLMHAAPLQTSSESLMNHMWWILCMYFVVRISRLGQTECSDWSGFCLDNDAVICDNSNDIFEALHLFVHLIVVDWVSVLFIFRSYFFFFFFRLNHSLWLVLLPWYNQRDEIWTPQNNDSVPMCDVLHYALAFFSNHVLKKFDCESFC